MASKNMKKLKRRLLQGQTEVNKVPIAEQHPRNYVKLMDPETFKEPMNKYGMEHCHIPTRKTV
jgi:hypothetical protein